MKILNQPVKYFPKIVTCKNIECLTECEIEEEDVQTSIAIGSGSLGSGEKKYAYVICPTCDSQITLDDMFPYLLKKIHDKLHPHTYRSNSDF